MRSCSVVKKLRIVPGSFSDYQQLAHYHYRDSHPGGCTAIFALRATGALALQSGGKAVGVIVYRTPSPGLELRNVATGNLFAGFDRATQLALVNKNIRCISRVILEPRFRGLGLASRLVRETMPRTGVPIIEAMAVMGLVNPFLERAGMAAYRAKEPARCVQLIEALSMVGIEKDELLDPQKVQERLDDLEAAKAEFIETQITSFLERYRERRKAWSGLERTRFVISKLTFRPVYYIWFNPELELVTC